jgi:hypothetical protein
VREKQEGGRREGRKRTLENTELVIAEKGESNPHSRSLENRDAVSHHRGLSSGVASGKSYRNR